MKPTICIKPGQKVIIKKTVKSSNISNISDKQVGLVCSVSDVRMDGRAHNLYVNCVILLHEKTGLKYISCVDQIAPCNLNYEECGEFITCIHCSSVFIQSKLNKTSFGEYKCAHCSTVNPTSSI